MKKRILMLATGGTIASRESSQGLAPAITSEELLGYVPGIGGAVPGGDRPADESGQHQRGPLPLAEHRRAIEASTGTMTVLW